MVMGRNILLSTLIIFLLLPAAKTQVDEVEFANLRFGAEVSPFVSWMYTNDNKINSNGMNIGLKLGAVSEYFFTENYAITSGLGLSFNTGGTLRHEVGGDLLARSDLSREELRNLGNGTDIEYHLQYLEIPLGLKMRTREFGYVRYFVNIPVFTFGIPIKARADINAPNVMSNGENVFSDIFFFNMSWGLGGGLEYSLSTETSFIGGVYYQQSFIDLTRDRGMKNDGTREDSKGAFGLVSLRLGVLF